MKRAAVLLIGATIVAIAALRGRVPTYPSWRDYVAGDAEGDALPPSDPYLERLR